MTILHAARAGAAFLLGVLLAAALPASAQEPPQIAPEKLQAARDLLEATKMDEQFTELVPLMFREVREATPPQSPDQQEEVERVFAEIEKRFLSRRGEIIDQIAILYAQKFTAEEMNTLAEFCRSPVGQKFIELTPELTSEAMKMGFAWAQKIGIEAEEVVRKELKRRGVTLEAASPDDAKQ
jgi:hypothetical protein